MPELFQVLEIDCPPEIDLIFIQSRQLNRSYSTEADNRKAAERRLAKSRRFLASALAVHSQECSINDDVYRISVDGYGISKFDHPSNAYQETGSLIVENLRNGKRVAAKFPTSFPRTDLFMEISPHTIRSCEIVREDVIAKGRDKRNIIRSENCEAIVIGGQL